MRGDAVSKAADVYMVPSVVTALQILERLQRAGQPQTQSDICAALNIPRSSGFNIIKTLNQLGYVMQSGDSKHYVLGPALVGLGAAASNAQGFALTFIVRPRLEALAHDTKLTSFLAQQVPNGHIFLEKVESHTAIRISIELGYCYPPFTGAPGKIFLAHRPETEVDRLWSEYPPSSHLSQNYPDLESWRREIAQVRTEGCASSLGEYIEGVNAIAAPVYVPNGGLLAIGVLGPTGALRSEHFPMLSERLRNVANEITTALGGRPPALGGS